MPGKRGVFVAFALSCAELCCAVLCFALLCFSFLVPASFSFVLPNLTYAYLTSNRQQPHDSAYYFSGFNGENGC
jgi:uncharacterized membrane protein YbhN (UPF0104 family)